MSSRPIRILVPCHWTPSSSSLCFLNWETQNWMQYPRYGLTTAEQRVRMTSPDLLVTLFLIHPRILLAFLAFLIWCFHVPSAPVTSANQHILVVWALLMIWLILQPRDSGLFLLYDLWSSPAWQSSIDLWTWTSAKVIIKIQFSTLKVIDLCTSQTTLNIWRCALTYLTSVACYIVRCYQWDWLSPTVLILIVGGCSGFSWSPWERCVTFPKLGSVARKLELGEGHWELLNFSATGLYYGYIYTAKISRVLLLVGLFFCLLCFVLFCFHIKAAWSFCGCLCLFLHPVSHTS